MYSLDIVFDSYKIYNENKSYRKTATLIKKNIIVVYVDKLL